MTFIRKITLQFLLTVLTFSAGFANELRNSDFAPNVNYCIPSFSNNMDYIKDVTTQGGITNLNNVNTGTGTNGQGYSDYTNQQLVITQGTNVSFNVYLGGFADYLSIWIDKNNDGIFNQNNERVYKSLIDATSFSGSLNTNSLPAGTYRIRMIAHYNTAIVEPCIIASFGEAEDYTLVVQGVQSCLPVTALNTSDATLTSIKISWTAGGTETSWNVEYGVAGFTQGTGTTIVVTNPFVAIAGLTTGTSYNVYVQANCGNGNESTWTGHFSFYIGYCQPQGLTTSNKYYVSKFYTTGATTNLNYSASSGVGYVNQTFLPFSVKAGIPFKWSISASTGENYYFFIWVDWDNNGVFDEPAVYKSAGYEIAPKNVSYTVNQPAGTYRMRVATAYMTGYSVGHCGPNTHGNYVDFTLVVTCPTIVVPTGEANQTFTYGQTIADLVVNGNNLVWYADAELTTTIPNTTELINGTTYYVVSESGNCKSSALAITVTNCMTLVAQPTGENNQIFTTGQTISDLVVNGTDLVWYSDTNLTTILPTTTELVHNTIYYVVSEVGNCKSLALVITVTDCANVVSTPTGATEQTFTAGQTISDLVVNGDNLVFYNSTYTETFSLTDELVDNQTYYVVSQVGDCQSDPLIITVTQTVSRFDFDLFGFTYYPNPVNDILYFSSNQPIENVVVSTILGQQVNVSLSSDKTSLDISNLPTGNYLVKITIEGVSKTIKVVKN